MKQLLLPVVVEPSDCCEFLVSSCNHESYKFLVEKFPFKDKSHCRITLIGPKMSGKTRLAKLWCGDGLYINCEDDLLDFRLIGNQYRVVVDNFNLADEVQLFHTINRCAERAVSLLLVSNEKYSFKLVDLVSRLNASYPLKILPPDSGFCLLVVQELCIMNRIRLKNTTLDYIRGAIKFDNFPDLWLFRVQLKVACDENRMMLDIETFRRLYDNWYRV
jgi:chromosomal replication initiation ATPase DnaA